MSTSTDEQVMLTLAGLTYRGFHDVHEGAHHDEVVRGAVLHGLQTLAPAIDWELVWGPVTSRAPAALTDSSAMYVVRDRRAPHRHVVAIRGTNPISASDWLLGDFLVGTTVPWPYAAATDGAAISKSTARELATLQAMRAHPPGPGSADALPSVVRHAVDTLTRGGHAVLGDTLAAHPSRFEAQLQKIAAGWRDTDSRRGWLGDPLQRAGAALADRVATLRRTVLATAQRQAGLDLLTFLHAQASQTQRNGEALDITVTGHSKGGALAPTVALWLKEALTSADSAERWDPTGRARVRCYAFAGPTPGNAAFARRIDQILGADHHRIRNSNDLVTHAWQVDELRQIPALYDPRRAPFAALIDVIAGKVGALDYRHAQAGVTEFAGRLDPDRSFVIEFVHQHLDAYLVELGLSERGIHALTFFF